MIIDNRNLSNVERMQYLCSSLSGDASNAFNYLVVIGANFAVTWDITMSHYENTRQLINGHLQMLFSLLQLSSRTFKDLQNLRDKVNMFKYSKISIVDTWKYILVFFISQKLDKSSRKA